MPTRALGGFEDFEGHVNRDGRRLATLSWGVGQFACQVVREHQPAAVFLAATGAG